MVDKKLFCVLEQSGETPSENSWKKKKAFTTSFSDYKRINWRTVHDPLSCGYYPGITWSEGRSILFEMAKDQYEYLVFLDDDVEFVMDEADLAFTISGLLEKFAPFSATFLDLESWAFRKMDKIIDANSGPLCVRSFDLQTFILKTSFANLVMPIPFHGFDKSMWYIQYIASTIYPEKQVCFTSPSVRNTRHEIHVNDSGKLHSLHGDFLFWRFSGLSIKRCLIPSRLDQQELALENKAASKLSPDLRRLDPDSKLLACLIDVNAVDWRGRNALMTHAYHKRNSSEYWRYRLTPLMLWRASRIKRIVMKIKSLFKN